MPFVSHRSRVAVALAMLGVLAMMAPTCTLAQRTTAAARHAPSQPRIGSRGAPIIQRDGLRFKDLNRSGDIEPYEDWRLTPDARARDLVARMTLEEKAGTMLHGTARSVGPMSMAGSAPRTTRQPTARSSTARRSRA